MAINITELTDLAKSRLEEAEMLFSQKKYDAATYLSGYTIELSLKARICKTLNWLEFPLTNSEFNKYGLNSLKTHDLHNLLHFSGIETDILTHHQLDWKEVAEFWEPENRYRTLGTVTEAKARSVIDAVTKLLTVL